MKFWQLLSICRGYDEVIHGKASGIEEWNRFAEWYERHHDLVVTQDRKILDYQLPDDFVCSVLSDIPVTLYLSADSWLRPMPRSEGDRPISVLEAFQKYGGDIVEDVLECGPVLVS